MLSVPPLLLSHTGPTFAVLDVQTAMLVLLVGAVLVLAKAVADLHRKLAAPAAPHLRGAVTPVPSSVAAPVPVPTATAVDDPRMLAAVVAAVQTALGGEAHRVVHISGLAGPAAWSIEGRRQIHASHVRR